MRHTLIFAAAACFAAPTAAQVRRVVPMGRAAPSVVPVPLFSLPLSAPSAAFPAPSLSASFAFTSLGLSPALFADAPSASMALPVAAPALGAGLRTMRTEDETWLADVVAQLSATRTGRRILRDVAVLVGERGYPIIVEVAPIINSGEFRYDSDLLVMDASHRRSDPTLVAPELAHELKHVLQRAQGLPSGALEFEIESYTVESRVWSELAIEPPKSSFGASARRRLLRGVFVFVPWLAKNHKDYIQLYGDTMAKYVQKVEKVRATTVKRIARAEKDIKAAERALVKMRAASMPEEAIAAYARESLESAQRRLREARVTLGWHDHDLALLADEAGRARFRAYSRGVIRRARSLSR